MKRLALLLMTVLLTGLFCQTGEARGGYHGGGGYHGYGGYQGYYGGGNWYGPARGYYGPPYGNLYYDNYYAPQLINPYAVNGYPFYGYVPRSGLNVQIF